jgi:hypothetical protein
MAPEAVEVVANPEAELPMEEFFERGNKRDRGEDVPELPRAGSDAGTTDTPQVDAAGNAASAKVDEPPKPDKRTREGRKASIQQEIDDLTTQKHSTKREVEAAQAELTRLRAERAALEKPADKPVNRVQAAPVYDGSDQSDPEPKLEDFKDHPSGDAYTAWLRATSAWEGRKSYRAEAYRSQADLTYRSRTMKLREKLAVYEKSHPDFGKSLHPVVADIQFSTPVMRGTPLGDLLIDSPYTAELLEHFSEHFDDFQRISTLHPILVGRELGKLEHRIESRTAAASSGPASKPIPVSAAKPPVKPVGSSPVVSDDAEDESELSVEEFFRRGNARDRQRARS